VRLIGRAVTLVAAIWPSLQAVRLDPPHDSPDPWEAGRLFKKKAKQDEALKLARREQDDEDEEEKLTEAEKGLFWVQRRRD
jgi:hypothetical protein